MNDNQQRLLSFEEARQRLGVGPTTLWAAIKRGEIEAKKFGRRTLFAESEIERFIGSLPSRTSSAGRAAR